MKLEISLGGVPDLPAHERDAAQIRYLEVLELVFGGPEAVWTRWEAARQAIDANARDSARWHEVASLAAKLALGGLRVDTSGASFTIARRT
jgi:hypothetical protein